MDDHTTQPTDLTPEQETQYVAIRETFRADLKRATRRYTHSCSKMLGVVSVPVEQQVLWQRLEATLFGVVGPEAVYSQKIDREARS